MRSCGLFVFVLLLTSTMAGAKETAVSSRITSVGLFKNGLVVVNRRVTVTSPGTYRLDDVPEPVHGTFWIESDAEVRTRLTTRLVEVPADTPARASFQQALAGKEVVVYFADGHTPAETGRVVSLEPARGEGAWSRAYRQPVYPSYGGWNPQPNLVQYLVLQTPKGRSYVDTSRIALLKAKGDGKTVKRHKPVALFEVGKMTKTPATISISYLAKGMAWVPSYRLDISDKKTLILEQKAVLKNELENLENTHISLISGFPSVQFAHVTSPLSLRSNWQEFFTQLSTPRRRGHASLDNVVSQQAVSFNRPAPGGGLDLSAIPTGDGVDLHYQEIGRHTLDEGDSMAIKVARAKSSYQRIVEWIVPDTRGVHGQHIQDYQRTQDPERYQDAAWDAVRFKNPFSFPMTTAPAMVVSKGRFNGQRMSYWVNSGEETTLHITKALSIRTLSVEEEERGSRKDLYLGGSRYYRTKVKGELRANNHRKETVTLVIRRRFSGDLLKADRSPRCILREEGAYSVNKRNQCTWSLKLKPGQEIKLNYRYSILVRY